MNLDLFKQNELRDPAFAGNTLAQQGALRSLNVAPIAAATSENDAWHEPSLVWHPECPQVALVVFGAYPGVSSFGYEFRELPGKRYTAACLCPDCKWAFGKSRRGEDSLRAFLRTLRGSRKNIPELPKFDIYVLRKDSFASVYGFGDGSEGSFTRWGDHEGESRLTDVELLPLVVKERLAIDFEPLRREVKAFDCETPIAF